MATYATLTVPVKDIIGAEFNASRASVWIEPNVPVVLADSVRVGGRREQLVNGVATFANLVTTDSADNPASFGYRVTITAPPKGAQKREDIVVLTTSDFPFTATANLKDIDEAWDNIVIPPVWRSDFRDEMEAAAEAAAASATSAAASASAAATITGISSTDSAVAALVGTVAGPLTQAALSATYAPVFTAEAEGTVGSGDDTALLNAALTKARAAKGTLRLVPGKTYIVSGALNPGGVRIEGRGATLKIKNTTTPAYSVLVPTSGCTIEGLTIDLNKASTTNPGNQLHGNGLLVNQTSWADLIVRDVTVKNGHQVGVHIYGPGASNADAVTTCPTLLDNVTVDNCTVANYSIKTVAGITLRDCRSLNAGGPSFYLSVVGQSQVVGCEARDGALSGIFLEYCQDVSITDGLYADNTQQGIAIGGGSDTLRENRNITVVGNTCRGNGEMGITVDPTKAAALQTWVAVYSTVANNVCEGNGLEGISLENAAHVAVSGNVCRANGGVGLRILGAYVNASGNVITGNTGKGLAVYGVAGHDNGHHRFGANTVLGNTAGDFDIAAITDGTVGDVVTKIPGSIRAQTSVHAAMDSAAEVWMGSAGPAGQAGVDIFGQKVYRPSIGVLRTDSWWLVDGGLIAGNGGSGAWDGGHFQLGNYHLWVDGSGRLRIKSSAPTSATDGTVVGTQT